MSHPEPITKLMDELKKLPGIGGKSAQRLAFHLLRASREDADRLCDAIREVKDRVTYCSTCNNITDIDPCRFCADEARDHSLICVVEEPQNVGAGGQGGPFAHICENVHEAHELPRQLRKHLGEAIVVPSTERAIGVLAHRLVVVDVD